MLDGVGELGAPEGPTLGRGSSGGVFLYQPKTEMLRMEKTILDSKVFLNFNMVRAQPHLT